MLFLGNPCNYKENVLQWSRGRQLAAYGNDITYGYNSDGIRAEKTVSGVLHRYYLEGDRIHKETYGSNTLWYYYEAGGLSGFEYNGTRYYYQKNIQGDIVRIFNESGGVAASYVYDAWGSHKVLNPDGTENTDSTFIGNINPFRYRGYYYDTETGLYYLNSRYYDPKLCRFINADDAKASEAYTHTLNGLNLFSYCLNNPVMHTDPSGHWILELLLLLFTIAMTGLAAIAFLNALNRAIWNPSASNIFAAIVAGIFL